MKKYVLLFLALSSLSFAAVTITSGKNGDTGGHLTVGGATSASININVSATVSAEGPAITIVDENDNPVTAVNFEHELKTNTALASQQQQELTANLKVIATAGNTATINSATLGKSDLALDTNLTSTLTTTVPTDGAVTDTGTPFGITSTLSGDVPTSPGEYSGGSTSLTITYSKN